ncbi:histidine kinase [Cavenderia fasciculata]|uniref:Histidine kinase n=1 Tax=Cavenderia fasciculata TaxID=261658 RepID=F4PJT8_CACFS|nr:histidine kinase [Cavenderia fasciculata]EGG23862.1 histidine kinase [Cavenderia fasciculata]|eukprot:XP_004361713.1 histidine kinase [Cavenderia fasciculata]
MDINLTFVENRAIRVVVLPIGDISNESFKEYTSLIRTLGIIELSGITRDANESKILEKISWVDGHMLLNFLDSTVPPKDEWEELHIYKKIFGVIGVVDCKRSRDLQETKKQFEQAVSRYPSAVATVCYAFDPLEDQQDLERGKFVMIPNVGDKKHLLFYLSTLLFDFSHTLLKHFEKMITEGLDNQASNSTNNIISTPLEIVKSWDEVARAKKRRPGRISKCKGDYCLLSGSPLDAIKYYDQSLEISKSNNDWEWIASSYEGYISAVLSKRNQEYHSQTSQISPTVPTVHHQLLGSGLGNNSIAMDSASAIEDQQIKDMATEAILCYNKRKTLSFEIELTIKMANYHASMERKTEASETLTQAFDLAYDLPLVERITIICSIALAYYSMGFKRKFAFYIREAAFLYNKKPENWEKINNLLIIASRFFQLEDLFGSGPTNFLEEKNKTYNYSVSTASNTKKQQSRSKSQQQLGRTNNNNNNAQGGGNRFQTRMPQLSITRKKEGWYILQRYLILNLISASNNLQDSLSITKYIIYLLRTQYKQLPKTKQLEFLSDLNHHSKCLSISINTNVHMNILGFPFLVKITPLALPDHLAPFPRQTAQDSQKEKFFFIYSPYEQRNNSLDKKKQMIWVEGECHFLVTLANPFQFDVLVQNITISTAGVPFESFPLSFKVLANTDKMDIVISGRTLRPGPLIIKGAYIRSFNLLSEHPIDPQGNAISIASYEQLVKRDAYCFDPETPVEPDDINKILIAPDLPLLQLSVPSYGSTLSLFTGEVNTFTIALENIGSQPIDVIQIGLEALDKAIVRGIAAKKNQGYASYEDDIDDPIFTWEDSIVQRNLPLPPGASFLLPIKVFVRPFIAGNQMIITYRSNQDTSYQRKVTVPLQLDINYGPEITNFDILYTSKKSLQSLEPYILMNNVAGQSPLNTSTGIQQKSPNIQNDYCLLLFEVKNNSSTHSFNITYNSLFKNKQEITLDNTKYDLAPNSTINIIVPMKREPFPENLPQIRQAKGQYIKPKTKLTEHEEYLNRLIQYFKDLFIKNIQLNWVSSDNTRGNVLLNGLILTSKMVYKLNNDPVTVEFKDHLLSKRFEVGVFQTLDIVITNVLNTPISGLILHLQPTVDREVENKTLDINKKIGYVGSLTIPIKELEAHKSYQHSFQVVFFERDSYKIIVSYNTIASFT